jgi:hypothetical protein
MNQQDFVDSIKSWVSLDNKLKVLSEKTKEIREERNDISERINVFVEENNLLNNVVEITGGKLKFSTNKSQTAITYKFLEKSLGEIYSQEEVEKIIEHLKNTRESKVEPEIKRYFDNI